MSLSAESLHKAFSAFYEQTDEQQLADLAEECEDLAEAAGRLAAALDEGKIELHAVEESFAGMMEDLCNKVEIYDGLTEGDDGEEDDFDFGLDEDDDDVEMDEDILDIVRRYRGND